MKKIICPHLILINDNLKINHQDAFSFLMSCSGDIHLFKLQSEANL